VTTDQNAASLRRPRRCPRRPRPASSSSTARSPRSTSPRPAGCGRSTPRLRGSLGSPPSCSGSCGQPARLHSGRHVSSPLTSS
jgi:hypothetical protein